MNEVVGAVQFHIEIRVSTAEMDTWSAAEIIAFFDGIAEVITARTNGQTRHRKQTKERTKPL